MPNVFNFSVSPFDALSPAQQQQVQGSVDIAYYRAGTVILDVGATPSHLWVNIKGHVTEYDGEDIIASYGVNDVWDGRALVTGRSSHRFVASEELLAYQVPRETVMALIAENATFGALLFSDLGQKLSALSQRGQEHELRSLTLSRVEEAYLRPAYVVSGEQDVLSVVRLMHDKEVGSVLVRDESEGPSRLGIFTQSRVQRAVLDGRPLGSMPVREWSHFSLLTISPTAQIGDALALLTRHRILRLVVMQGDLILGILEALDLFSFLSNQSHLIALQIDAAESVEQLAQASKQITRLVTSLYRNGTRVGLIAGQVQDLQARLDGAAQDILDAAVQQAREAGVDCQAQARTGNRPYELIIAAAQAHGCDLIFMASHGRRGVQALLLGSETQKVLTHSRTPVLVYR